MAVRVVVLLMIHQPISIHHVLSMHKMNVKKLKQNKKLLKLLFSLLIRLLKVKIRKDKNMSKQFRKSQGLTRQLKKPKSLLIVLNYLTRMYRQKTKFKDIFTPLIAWNSAEPNWYLRRVLLGKNYKLIS